MCVNKNKTIEEVREHPGICAFYGISYPDRENVMSIDCSCDVAGCCHPGESFEPSLAEHSEECVALRP